MKRILIGLMVFMAILAPSAGAEEVWLRFTLIGRPYYDRTGDILASIDGRQNRKGIDEFSGGGRVYPVIPGKLLKWCQKDATLLVHVDMPDPAAYCSKSEALAYQPSPKLTQEYDFKDFKTAILTAAEAEALLITWHYRPEKSAESGVTK